MMGFCCTRLAWFRHGDDRDVTGNESVPAFIRDNAPLFCFGFREHKTKPSLSGCAQNEDGKSCKACVSRCISCASSHLVCRTRERTNGFLAISKSSGFRLFCFGFRERKTKPSLSRCRAKARTGNPARLACRDAFRARLHTSSAAPERTNGFLAISKSSGFRLFCFGFRERKTKPSLSGCAQNEDGKSCKACVSRCISFASSHLVCRTRARTSGFLAISKSSGFRLFCFGFRERKTKPSLSGCAQNEDGKSCKACVSRCISCALRISSAAPESASSFLAISKSSGLRLFCFGFRERKTKPSLSRCARKSEDGKSCKACVSRCISCASSHLVCRTRERKQVLGNLQVVCFALVSGSARQSQVCQGARKSEDGKFCKACVSRCISCASSHLVCRTRERTSRLLGNLQVVWFSSVLLWFQGAQDKAKSVRVRAKARTGNSARLACRDAFRAHFASRLPHQRAQAGSWQSPSRLFCFGFRERKTKPSLSGCAQKRGREILQGLRVEMHFVRVFTPRLPHRSAQAASWQSPSRLVFVCFALVSGSARQSQVCQGARKTRTGNPARLACRDAFRARLRTSSAAPESAQAASWQSPSFRLFCFGFRERKTKPSLSGCAQKRGREILQGCVSRCISCASSHFVCRTGAHKRLLGNLQVVWFSSVLLWFQGAQDKAKPVRVRAKRGRKILQGLRVEMYFVCTSHLVCRTRECKQVLGNLQVVCFALVSGSARQSQACQGARKSEDGKFCKAACRDAFRSRLRTSSAAPERTSGFLAISKSSGLRLVPCVT